MAVIMRTWAGRVEKALWLVFLASLAFQARIILWKADELFIEWRSASLYATDLLFVLLLLFAIVRVLRTRSAFRVRVSTWDYALGALVIAAVVSMFNAEHLRVAGYGLIRLVQGIALYGYVRWYANEVFDHDTSLLAFVLGAVAQAALGLAQYFLQQHVGLHAIGETILHPAMSGVAVFYNLAGEKTLRAYGTFPHPNVLAMHVVLALTAVAYLYLRHSAATVRRESWVWLATTGVLLWGFLATFSRTVIAAAVGAIAIPFIWLMHERRSRSWANVPVLRRRARNWFLFVLAASVLFGVLFWSDVLARVGISPHEEAVQLRSYYNAVALSSGDGLFGINWFGAGIGNFVTWLMQANPHLPGWQYQPAHNLYLLVYTEMGLMGSAALAAFVTLLLLGVVRTRTDEPFVRIGLLAIAGMVIFVALFDHYFWTIQQGRLLWWLFWGVVGAYAGQHPKSRAPKYK